MYFDQMDAKRFYRNNFCIVCFDEIRIFAYRYLLLYLSMKQNSYFYGMERTPDEES